MSEIPDSPPPSPMARDCLLCVQPVEHFAVLPCGHNLICALCTLRLREQYESLSCAVCKAECESVIITSNRTKNFGEFDKRKLKYDTKMHLYFDGAKEQEYVQQLNHISCLVAGCEERGKSKVANARNWKELKTHMREQHGLFFCAVCLEEKPCFPAEQVAFSQRDLETHKRLGDGASFKGHPDCKFCRSRFLDDEYLFEHMKIHETCGLCESDGVLFQYYNTRDDLNTHLSDAHFVCEEGECANVQLHAFKTEAELNAHTVAVHGHKYSQRERAQKRRLGVEVLFTDERERFAGRERGRGQGHGRGGRHRGGRGRPGGFGRGRPRGSDDDEVEASGGPSPHAASSSGPATAEAAAAAAFAPAAESMPAPRSAPAEVDDEVTRRNKEMVAKMKEILKSKDKFESFKEISAKFRGDSMSPQEYYDAFLALFAEDALSVFPDLVALLPDPRKRIALEEIHGETRRQAALFPSLQRGDGAAGPSLLDAKRKGSERTFKKTKRPGSAAPTVWGTPGITAAPGSRGPSVLRQPHGPLPPGSAPRPSSAGPAPGGARPVGAAPPARAPAPWAPPAPSAPPLQATIFNPGAIGARPAGAGRGEAPAFSPTAFPQLVDDHVPAYYRQAFGEDATGEPYRKENDEEAADDKEGWVKQKKNKKKKQVLLRIG